MSLWIKICANTSLEDARLAAEAGADAVGFVFAPSPRRVTVEQVTAITPYIAIEKIGVFGDASAQEMEDTARACKLTGIQLHGGYVPEIPKELRGRLGAEIKILRVVHFGPDALAQTRAYLADPNVSAVLVDSRTATATGGTGIPFDWREAQRTLFQDAEARARLVVAGGLNPENVAEAIATLRPAAIDVASGVEASPGRKDPAKVRAFIERARAAFSN